MKRNVIFSTFSLMEKLFFFHNNLEMSSHCTEGGNLLQYFIKNQKLKSLMCPLSASLIYIHI